MKFYSNKLSKIAVIVLIVGQLSFSFSFMLYPKKAEALFGVGDFNFSTQVGNFYDILKDIGIGVAQRLAISYANKYLTKFVDKLINKYRIKDYLAYDKVLSGHYLNQLIFNSTDDPDLRAIYGILARDVNSRATVTDPKTGKSKPVMVALREKLDVYYHQQGGINSNNIYNPGAAVTDQQYFARVQAYFSSPPDFSRQNTYGEFARLKAASDKAAGTEIGNNKDGLKNDRSTPPDLVAHTCKFSLLEDESLPWLVRLGLINMAEAQEPPPPLPSYPTPGGNAYLTPYSTPVYVETDKNTEEGCINMGGEWVVDKTAIAQSVIQNPSAFVHNFATAGIQQIFASNFGVRDNIYTTIGSLLGNFIFNKLNLEKSGGTYNESGSKYDEKNASVVPPVKDLDIDGDSLPDGQDVDDDDKLTSIVDACYHGGTAPNCKGSKSVTTSPYFTPICTAIDRATSTLEIYAKFLDDHAELIEGGRSLKGAIIGQILLGPVGAAFSLGFLGGGSSDNFKDKADASLWARRAGEAHSVSEGVLNAIQSYHSPYWDNTEIVVNRYTDFMSKISQSLQKDQDLDLSKLRGNGGGGLDNLMKNTGMMLRYLRELKVKIGKCENPNLQAVSLIPTPPIDPGGGDDDNDEFCLENPQDNLCPDPPGDAATKHGNHKAEVEAARQELIDEGKQFPEPGATDECYRFEIVKRAVARIGEDPAGQQAGFLAKNPGQNNCNGFGVDVIAFPDGYIYDVLQGDPSDANWLPVPCGTRETNGTCPDKYLAP
jgi:hypothetical protein